MLLIVVPPKTVSLLLRVVERREPMHVQTLLEPSVEGFDRRGVGRLPSTTDRLTAERNQHLDRTIEHSPVAAGEETLLRSVRGVGFVL